MTKNSSLILMVLSIAFLTTILHNVLNAGHDNFLNGIGFAFWCYIFYNSIIFLVDSYDARKD